MGSTCAGAVKQFSTFKKPNINTVTKIQNNVMVLNWVALCSI